jgi:hypothetical protein
MPNRISKYRVLPHLWSCHAWGEMSISKGLEGQESLHTANTRSATRCHVMYWPRFGRPLFLHLLHILRMGAETWSTTQSTWLTHLRRQIILSHICVNLMCHNLQSFIFLCTIISILLKSAEVLYHPETCRVSGSPWTAVRSSRTPKTVGRGAAVGLQPPLKWKF